MITNQVQLTQLRPTAEIINDRVRIHEYDADVPALSFQLKNDIPWLPICDEFVARMKQFSRDIEASRVIDDRKARYEIQVSLKKSLQEFAAEVEDALNAAMGIR
jgi:hypothetical protein